MSPIAGETTMLRCEVEAHGRAAIVHVAGEIDMSNAGEFALFLRRATAFGQHVIVNMTHVLYVDGRGLHALREAEHECQRRRRRLMVAGAVPIVRRVMGIVRLDEAIACVDSVEEALQVLGTVSNGAD